MPLQCHSDIGFVDIIDSLLDQDMSESSTPWLMSPHVNGNDDDDDDEDDSHLHPATPSENRAFLLS
jgi:hypothetical protein